MTERVVLDSMPFDMALGEALGDRLRVLPHECGEYAISGTVPKAVAQASNADEAALVLRAANAEGAVVVLRGAGTKSHRPPAPRSVDLVMDLQALSGVLEHAAPDLTATVLAATPLAELERVLDAHGQFWPSDAPFFESATVGGTIAANANGALRQRYGALRDLVVGARFITATGSAARAGSKVVKSVAGYDTHKLLVGSFGTLALLVEVTVKVAPLPQTERTLIARFAGAAEACAAASALARSPYHPMAMTLHDGKSAHRVGALLAHGARDRWMLVVRCGGNRKSVERQLDGAAEICGAAGSEAIADLDRAATRRAWMQIRELAAGAEYTHDRWLCVKAVCMPSQVHMIAGAAASLWPAAEITAHVWAGVCYVHVPLDGDASALAPLGASLAHLSAAGAMLSILSAPAFLALGLPDVRQPKLPVKLLRSVKAALDPAGVLDPGRLPGGV